MGFRDKLKQKLPWVDSEQAAEVAEVSTKPDKVTSSQPQPDASKSNGSQSASTAATAHFPVARSSATPEPSTVISSPEAEPPKAGSSSDGQDSATPVHPAPTIASEDQNPPQAQRNLSEEAFRYLEPSIQDQIRSLLPGVDTAQFTASVKEQVNELVEIVQVEQDACKDKFMKINVFGRDVVFRDYVKTSHDIIEKVGDVAINFAPAPGSVVWGGVKTLMKVRIPH